MPIEEKAVLKSRQGVRYPLQEGLIIGDPDTMEPLPKDGQTIGEIFLRGNIMMKG